MYNPKRKENEEEITSYFQNKLTMHGTLMKDDIILLNALVSTVMCIHNLLPISLKKFYNKNTITCLINSKNYGAIDIGLIELFPRELVPFCISRFDHYSQYADYGKPVVELLTEKYIFSYTYRTCVAHAVVFSHQFTLFDVIRNDSEICSIIEALIAQNPSNHERVLLLLWTRKFTLAEKTQIALVQEGKYYLEQIRNPADEVKQLHKMLWEV